MNSLEFANSVRERLSAFRRDLHQYPEPGWLEYRTASIVAGVLTDLGYDVKVGAEVLKLDARMGLPSEEEMKAAMDRAITEGADPHWVEAMGYGKTAIVATKKFSDDGPVVAFRFDMDCVDVQESCSPEHLPFREQFLSKHPNCMHACGHDAHVTMGLCTAAYIAQNPSQYKGTIKFIFQPAEEGVRGGRAMCEAGIVDDVNYFFGAHIGMSSQLAGVLACMNPGFLATSKLDAEFTGYAAHAGGSPERGKNALLAAATAALNLQSISRHSEGISRINVGVLNAGTGRNVIPDKALLKIETRGSTTSINDYIKQRATQVLEGAAIMQDVSVEIKEMGSAPCSVNSEELAAEVKKVAEGLGIFKRVDLSYSGGGSEDCAYFLERVIQNGNQATYMILGCHLGGPHHNSAFDIEEGTMVNGVATFGAIIDHYLHQ